MKYAKGGVLPGKVDYEPEIGERIIPLKELQRVVEIHKEQCEKYEEGGQCRMFWTPAHAEIMLYFRLLLMEQGITWTDWSDDLMIRTKFKLNADDREDWSVICGKFSMGGTDGLLEVWNPADDEPSGGYTIDEVMEMVEKARTSDEVHKTDGCTPPYKRPKDRRHVGLLRDVGRVLLRKLLSP